MLVDFIAAQLSLAPSRWAPFACGNQIPQTFVDVEAPRVRALIEALVLRDQILVSEADFGLISLL